MRRLVTLEAVVDIDLLETLPRGVCERTSSIADDWDCKAEDFDETDERSDWP